MVVLDEVVASAAEYARIHENLKNLQTELKNVRESIRGKMEPLKTRQTQLASVILEYLDANKLPGVKLHGTMFLKEEIVPYKTREAKIEDVLTSEPATSRPEILSKKIVTMLRKRIILEDKAGPDGNDGTDNPKGKEYRLKIMNA
jgi:hypothetical protein